MAIAALRREGESNERLIGRWKKKAQQAGIMQQFREKLRYKKDLSVTKERERAKVREGYRAEKKKNQFYA